MLALLQQNTDQGGRKLKKKTKLTLFIIVAVITFIVLNSASGFIGYRLGCAKVENELKTFFQGGDFSLFLGVWKLIKEKYYQQPVDGQKLIYGAIKGLAQSLGDPYTNFYYGEEAKEYRQHSSNQYAGIGAVIELKNDRAAIRQVMEGSPAEKAGLKNGDVIMAVDGKDTKGMKIDDVVALVKGEKGTSVVLTISREGVKSTIKVSVTRDIIQVKSVSWEMKENGIVYLKLADFSGTAEEEFRAAAEEIIKKHPKGLILDLRYNPGGSKDIAMEIIGYWAPLQTGMITKDADGVIRKDMTGANGSLSNLPTVVLINQYSASAAEVLSGALKDYGKAILVGEKTFGKGVVQSVYFIQDGTVFSITTEEWFTPKGYSIHKKGIEPDVKVVVTEEDLKNGKDHQLNKALEILRKALEK